MGMPSRLHGKMVPLAPGKTETCPYCYRQYTHVIVVVQRGKTTKLCPFCREVLSGLQGLQAKLKSVIRKASTKANPKRKPTIQKASTRARSKKK